MGFRLKIFFFLNDSLGTLEIIPNYKMKKEQKCEIPWPIMLSGNKKKCVVQESLKLDFILSCWPADLMYLHDRPRPCGGAVVVVDIVSSSLCVLSLFPSGGQALCGHCVTCC